MAKIKFDIPEAEEKPTAFSFKLLKNEIDLIENYTHFLSQKHHKKIEKEIVLKGLLKPLSKDKEFLEFLKKEAPRIGAISEKKQKEKKAPLKSESTEKVESTLAK